MRTNGGGQSPLFGLLFVGFQLVGSIVLGYFLGNFIDRTWDTTPWGIFLGVVLGAIAGFIGLIRAINRVLK